MQCCSESCNKLQLALFWEVKYTTRSSFQQHGRSALVFHLLLVPGAELCPWINPDRTLLVRTALQSGSFSSVLALTFLWDLHALLLRFGRVPFGSKHCFLFIYALQTIIYIQLTTLVTSTCIEFFHGLETFQATRFSFRQPCFMSSQQMSSQTTITFFTPTVAFSLHSE